jgi:hypothetical protein
MRNLSNQEPQVQCTIPLSSGNYLLKNDFRKSLKKRKSMLANKPLLLCTPSVLVPFPFLYPFPTLFVVKGSLFVRAFEIYLENEAVCPSIKFCCFFRRVENREFITVQMKQITQWIDD